MANLSDQLALSIAYCHFPGCLACPAFSWVLGVLAPVLTLENSELFPQLLKLQSSL